MINRSSIISWEKWNEQVKKTLTGTIPDELPLTILETNESENQDSRFAKVQNSEHLPCFQTLLFLYCLFRDLSDSPPRITQVYLIYWQPLLLQIVLSG